MTNSTINRAPTDQDLVGVLNGVIGDYFGGIVGTVSDLEADLQGWAEQIVSFAVDFNENVDTEGAIVTDAILDELGKFDGPYGPILINSTYQFFQLLNDASYGRLSKGDVDDRINDVFEAFRSDVERLSKLPEPELLDELLLTRLVTSKVLKAVLPVLEDSAGVLGNAILSYIDAFVIGADVGTDGDDAMVGGVGSNMMLGLRGDDDMDGGWGNDKMFGGEGDDLMEGSFGHDAMYGGANDDVMSGDSGNDKLSGDTGADQIDGGYGNDLVDGGADNDVVNGGANNDVVFGGDGDDMVIGGYGQDKLTGGEGGDTFVFDDFSGHDVITDWEAGVDKIEISGLTWTYGNLKIRQNGDDAEISYSLAKIVLEDTDTSAISADDFVFV